MSADLVAIESVKPKTQKDREKRVRGNHEATKALETELKARALIWPTGKTEIDELWRNVFGAAFDMQGYWEGRTRKTERTLRDMLALDVLSDEQRQQIIAGVYGKDAADTRDGNLHHAEHQMIAVYRTMDEAGRVELCAPCSSG